MHIIQGHGMAFWVMVASNCIHVLFVIEAIDRGACLHHAGLMNVAVIAREYLIDLVHCCKNNARSYYNYYL